MYRLAKFNDEEFLRAWIRVSKSGGRVRDVAKQFKITCLAASCRAYRLRKAGVRIPKLCRGRKKHVDVSKLNRIAKRAA